MDAQRDQDSPGRLEMIGDSLAPQHPVLARWFYQKLREWVSGLPIQCISDWYQVDGLVADASAKLDGVEARLGRGCASP
jgi:hypothetical protein